MDALGQIHSMFACGLWLNLLRFYFLFLFFLQLFIMLRYCYGKFAHNLTVQGSLLSRQNRCLMPIASMETAASTKELESKFNVEHDPKKQKFFVQFDSGTFVLLVILLNLILNFEFFQTHKHLLIMNGWTIMKYSCIILKYRKVSVILVSPK